MDTLFLDFCFLSVFLSEWPKTKYSLSDGVGVWTSGAGMASDIAGCLLFFLGAYLGSGIWLMT